MNRHFETLVERLSTVLYAAPTRLGPVTKGGAPSPRLSESQRAVVRGMLHEAMRNGIMEDAIGSEFEEKRPGSGSTAEVVAFITQPLRVVMKQDSSRKLVREAQMLQFAALREDIPATTKRAIPRIYALKDDEAPYAYLMREFTGYTNLADLLVAHQSDDALCLAMARQALGPLLDAYEATARNASLPLVPNFDIIHLQRFERLRQAAEHEHDELGALLRQQCSINGQTYPSFVESFTWLERNWRTVRERLTPEFCTFVHGDPNPENLLLREEVARPVDEWEVGLIDPKEWGNGDYVFDFAKITHYLNVTWAVERAKCATHDLVRSAGSWSLTYDLGLPRAVRQVVSSMETALRDFASGPSRSGSSILDPTWSLRYDLSLASNLLGLPDGRFRMGRVDAAVVMLAAGLEALAVFRTRFERFIS